ncbi:hypothetical protein [Streptacidiphilus anmyonensis]|uniref:hypothetical protein n=1 Tax=Streptacidiphilus anmyonensis TaxID=405782 RepID=UPI0005AA7B48|nr:hypothetical protein [Streptacidiphilus anmyonensis]
MTRRSYHSNRRRARRAVRSLTRPHLVRRLLTLPARLGVRWLVIAFVMVAAFGVYGRILVTAPPMPPSKAPSTAPTQWAVR